MAPAIPASAAVNGHQGRTRPKTPGESKASALGTMSRHPTPRQDVNGTPTRPPSGRNRGSTSRDNDTEKASSRSVRRRESVSASINRTSKERVSGKDGTAQRHAKEVEGLKDYQLGQCLGRGAFGSVYCALNWSTGETVAIKQVRLSDMPRMDLTVIMQEIDLLKNLNHPNIVKYHGFVKSPDSLYIILEYCEQGSLHSICKNFGKFPENLVALYTAQVLQGLLFLHEQGVIHRDIKGANILTTKEGLVKLADFGVATNTNVATKGQDVAEGSVVGTPYWMAPEVIELSGATTASDIWSLGCTVIELLDGKPPYHKFAPMPALFRIVNDDHPPLPEGASPLVRDFLLQCFQKDPNLRVTAKKLLKHPWIMSAKKADTRKPQYQEAIKSVQEWNEALKASPPQTHNPEAISRRPSTRPGSRPASRSAVQPSLAKAKTKPTVSIPTAKQPLSRLTNITSQKPAPSEASQDGRDNWDDDFVSLATSFTGLQIPEHRRPQDHFAGLFSSEKLKQYANADMAAEMDGKLDGWDLEYGGEATVRSPSDLPSTSRAASNDAKHRPPSSLAKKNAGLGLQERRMSRDSQPRTQILRPASRGGVASKTKTSVPPKTRIAGFPTVSTSKDDYREEDEEDYSDLIPRDETDFQKRLAGFSPNRPYKPNDLRGMQLLSGSVKGRRVHTPTQLVHDAAAMRRTRSSLEIQKYAEDDNDDDFGELIFEGQSMSLHSTSSKNRSPQSALSASSESLSERGTMKHSNSISWGEDAEEEDDPFAALEEELDEVDLQTNVARDKHARLCTLVEALVSDLKVGQSEDFLADIVEQLWQILSEAPDVKHVLISSHGMLPILEILETPQHHSTVLGLLKIVNCMIFDNMVVQENLCFVGGIPIITSFAQKKYPLELRLEAAVFVRMMYDTPTLTLQMFVSCGGLNVLVEFLEEDYDSPTGRELVLVGVNGIWSVFELQGPTPKNDFCRIFSRSSVLYPLSLVLNRVLDEDSDAAEIIQGRIVNIFLLFSQAENHVKETVADRMVLKRVLKDLKRMEPQHQITMLKFIKNLSMLATTLDALQNSNAIEVLTDLLGHSMRMPHSREISNQVLNTMFNLCRLSKARQEDAALSGIVPLLQKIVQTERPLKEFALPILCDMVNSGKVGRKVLWQNKGLQFYVSLLADQYWAATALDAIFIWLQEETSKVEEHLLAPSMHFDEAMVQCFNESRADSFESLLDPLQKLLRLSPAIAANLGHRSLFERSAVKLHAKKALVRLNLLRVIRSICDASGDQESLIRQYGLLESVQELARHDPAILVREMANELARSSEVMPLPTPRSALGPLRRSSSSISTTSPLATTPNTIAMERRGYFDLPTSSSTMSSARMSPFRPPAREASTSSNGIYTSAASTAMRTNRMSARQSTVGLPARPSSRLSLMPVSSSTNAIGFISPSESSQLSATQFNGFTDGTPSETPPSSNTRAAALQRRRRQTSGAEVFGR